ncbi:MAG: endolytic transglycosylase MltG [Candidatus Peribacteraceae bacterium]|nr:endolytic transglycosylase MltG [Candidatus Peribacteraceae bacterium]MBP9850063.1 endolytic transglycosylase MltG [Candidatus Peribacteraceae bacterium]
MRRFLLILVIGVIMCGLWFRHALSPVDSTDTKEASFTVQSGQSIGIIAANLKERGLIRSPLVFKWYARLTGVAGKLQAGSFAVSPSASSSEIIAILHSGKTQEFLITVPEGYTVADIDALFAAKGLGEPGDIIACAFTCDFSSFDFLPPTGAQGGEEFKIGSKLEGYLFPETYSVSPTDYVPKFALERMLGTFRKRIVTEYAEDISKSGYTLHEVVTMASLVEEESRHDEERAQVAGILWKRLENAVVLGVDATTRYRLNKMREVLTKADVEIQSAYNTRRTQGLPPSPIANPSENSVIAALKPTESQYWYYLHDNTGAIRYAVTNDEHNRNRAKYLGN